MIPFDKIGDELVNCLAAYADTSGIEPRDEEDGELSKAEIDKATKIHGSAELQQGACTQPHYDQCINTGSYCAYDCEIQQHWAVMAPQVCLTQPFYPNCTSQNRWTCDQNVDFRCTGATNDCQDQFDQCIIAFTQYDDTCTRQDPISCGVNGTRFACGSITGEGFNCQDSTPTNGYHCAGQWFSCFVTHSCHTVTSDIKCESGVFFYCDPEFNCQSGAVTCISAFTCDQTTGKFNSTACVYAPGHQFRCPAAAIHCDTQQNVFSCTLGQEYLIA